MADVRDDAQLGGTIPLKKIPRNLQAGSTACFGGKFQIFMSRLGFKPFFFPHYQTEMEATE